MDYRRANRAYLYMILSTIGLVLVLSLWYLNGGAEVSILMNNILSEAVVLIPALAAVFYSGDKLSVLIPFHKIRNLYNRFAHGSFLSDGQFLFVSNMPCFSF